MKISKQTSLISQSLIIRELHSDFKISPTREAVLEKAVLELKNFCIGIDTVIIAKGAVERFLKDRKQIRDVSSESITHLKNCLNELEELFKSYESALNSIDKKLDEFFKIVENGTK